MSAAQAQRKGMGLLGWLTLIFAAAKVFGFSTMSWLWVFAPVWLPLSILLGLWLFGALLLGIVAAIDHTTTRKN